jgi:ADP-ribosylglycohydrolase
MPGKGHFSEILPGQLTDDSEMALSLADGLLK